MQKLSSPKLSSPIKLIKDSFKIFFERKNIVYFISIYLVMVPFRILESISFTTPIVVVNILHFVVYLLTSIAGILAVKKVVDNERLNFKDTMFFAWKNLWGFFLLSALLLIIILGGSVLLIIPGLIFSTWFSFANFVFVDQGLGVKASLGKSRELVKGRFWAVFGRIFVFGFLSGLIGLAVLKIPFGIGPVISTLASALFVLPYYLLYKEINGQ
jgi:hypothetical protein